MDKSHMASAFAQAQLARFGWKRGQGLGKNESGIKEALKVKQKRDTDGLGKKPDQFDFAWWDHVYNRAASNIVVEKDDSGDDVKVQRIETLTRADIVTTQKPDDDDDEDDDDDSAAQPRAKAAPATPLYNHFVSSASKLQTTAGKAKKTKKDYSMKLSDEQLLEICEGRRLGQRGSFKQHGKEKRLERHDVRAAPSEAGSADDQPAGDQPADDASETQPRPLKKRTKSKKTQDAL